METDTLSPLKVRSNFLKYALGLTSVSAASSLSAQVVSWDSGNATGDGLPLTASRVGFWLNGDTAGSTNGNLTLYNSGAFMQGFGASGYSFLGTSTFTFYNFGDTIDGSAGFSAISSSITSASTRYIGFQSFNGNFGWASIIFDSGSGVTLSGFGYESNASNSITAGATAVPEPASAALAIAAGAAGFAALRRRRTVKSAAV
jgi:hypothetical protein